MSRRLVLARRPSGLVEDGDFRIEEGPVPSPGTDEFVVRVEWLSFEPTQRNWINDVPSYMPPVALGEVMRAFGAGTVVESNHADYPVGAVVQGMFGWREHVVTGPAGVSRIHPGVPPEKALGVFSTTGLTAYFGMLDVALVREGDVVVVSAAAGATGSVAGQIARIKGASRVVGIAGGERKCAWVRDVAGFDECIDHRAEDVGTRMRELAPEGVDVYFDNVGGDILEAAIANLALHSRIALCGAISTGYDLTPRSGPANIFRLIERRARIEGFLVLDYLPRFGDAVKQLAEWVAAGRIVTVEDVEHGGLDRAPATLRRLFEGRNFGKQLLHIEV